MTATGIDGQVDATLAPPAPPPVEPPVTEPAHTEGGVDAAMYSVKWIIAIGVTLASAMELVDTSIVNVALAQMSANLGATLDEIAWVSTGYIVAAVIVLPMTGWLSAYFGRRRYFTGSIIIFTITSVLCGQSSSLTELVLWRIAQGVGGAALVATSQAILFDAFPLRERTMASALYGVGMMVGPAIGPTLGGYIVNRYTWPWIFYINVPFGILAAIITATFVRDSHHQHRAKRIDLVGIALIACGIGALQFVLERGEHYEWFESNVIRALMAVAALGIVALVFWELHVKEPVLDLRVLKNRSLAGASIFAMGLGCALYGSVFAVPIYLQQLRGWTAEQAGWVLFPGAIGAAVAMGLIVKLNTKVKDLRWFVVVGAVTLSFSMVLHARFTTESGAGDMLWPIFLRGFGTGCMFVPLAMSAVAGLKGKDVAVGTALFNLTRQLGGSMGIAVLANLLTRQTAVHRAALVEHIVTGSALTQERLTAMRHALVAHGMNGYEATKQALALLSGIVDGQAAMLAFRDIFRLVGVIMFACLPLILLLRRPASGRIEMSE